VKNLWKGVPVAFADLSKLFLEEIDLYVMGRIFICENHGRW
jgi:hypothetical protein